jgi:hypothetical protein
LASDFRLNKRQGANGKSFSTVFSRKDCTEAPGVSHDGLSGETGARKKRPQAFFPYERNNGNTQAAVFAFLRSNPDFA